MKTISVFVLALTLIVACSKTDDKHNQYAKYNLINEGAGVYSVIKKNVKKEEINNSAYEKLLYENDLLMKIERYDSLGSLSDGFSVPATTKFIYNKDGLVNSISYYNKEGKKAVDELFEYHSIEYVYDNQNRVKAEFYKDVNGNFLEVPSYLESSNQNFIPPILTYEYSNGEIIIKAFDENFNLLKTVAGEKPCIPFIDCGEE